LVFTGFQTNKYDIWCGIFSSHLLVNHNAIFRPWGVTAIWGIRGDKATDSHPLLQPAAAGEKTYEKQRQCGSSLVINANCNCFK